MFSIDPNSFNLFDIAKPQTRRHRDTFKRGSENSNHLGEEPKIHCDRKSKEAAILRLPGEVMEDIFKSSQLVSYDCSGENSEDSDWCWITITHVCAYWRNIAKDAQGLWSCIDIGKQACLEQTETYLQRSRNSALNVYFDDHESIGNKDARECIKSVIHHIHRIRELHLQNVRDLDFLPGLFSNPAPALENFSLRIDLTSMGSSRTLDVKSLLAGHAPKMTNLSMHAFARTWENIPIFQNLRYLHITNPLTLREIVSIVTQNPNYEVLRFSWVKVNGLPKYTHDQPRIRLHSLKNVVLGDTNCSILYQLLQRVDFPTESSWDFSFIDFPFKMQPLRDPKPYIPRTSCDDRRFQKLKLDVSGHSVKITAESHNAPQLRRSLRYWGVYFSRETVSIIDTFDLIGSVVKGDFWCSAIELTVEIGSFVQDYVDRTIGDQAWIPLLKLFPDLHKVTVKLEDVYNFTPISGLLIALGGHTEMTSNYDVACPSLTELHLCGLDLSRRDEIESVVAALRRRSQHGMQLSLLRVTNMQNKHFDLPDENLRLLQVSGVARMIEVIV